MCQELLSILSVSLQESRYWKLFWLDFTKWIVCRSIACDWIQWWCGSGSWFRLNLMYHDFHLKRIGLGLSVHWSINIMNSWYYKQRNTVWSTLWNAFHTRLTLAPFCNSNFVWYGPNHSQYQFLNIASFTLFKDIIMFIIVGSITMWKFTDDGCLTNTGLILRRNLSPPTWKRAVMDGWWNLKNEGQ